MIPSLCLVRDLYHLLLKWEMRWKCWRGVLRCSLKFSDWEKDGHSGAGTEKNLNWDEHSRDLSVTALPIVTMQRRLLSHELEVASGSQRKRAVVWLWHFIFFLLIRQHIRQSSWSVISQYWLIHRSSIYTRWPQIKTIRCRLCMKICLSALHFCVCMTVPAAQMGDRGGGEGRLKKQLVPGRPSSKNGWCSQGLTPQNEINK